MGGLYNIMNGVNPVSAFTLPMLGHKEDFYPRLRDTSIATGKDGVREIQVLTRVGSLNQNCGMGEERLYAEPNFLRFEDCEDDRTYGVYVFKCPAQWEHDFDCICKNRLCDLSDAFIEAVRNFWPNHGNDIADALIKAKASKPGKGGEAGCVAGERFASIVAEMRSHERGEAKDAFYTPQSWRKLCDRLEAAVRREAANIERLVRDAIVGYQEAYASAPNDDCEREMKERAKIGNDWLAEHGFEPEAVNWSKEETPCL